MGRKKDDLDVDSDFHADYSGYRLASLISEIQPSYDVIVIGSGYGGSIAASRCSRAGKTVCVLEKGKEWMPGDFPETTMEATKHMQITNKSHKLLDMGEPTDLYDIVMGPEVTVIQGCGLGGTSLINANVGLDVDPRVFEDEAWPKALRDDLTTLNGADRGRVFEMLRPTEYPDTHPDLPKHAAMKKIATEMVTDIEDIDINGFHKKAPLYVNFKRTKKNHVGVPQPACVGCGNCCSGCNTGAKNTLNMNYLPDAKAHGAKIFTEVEVLAISRDENSGRWLVSYHPHNQNSFDKKERTVSAETVILGAGALGSTNILLKSAARGLELSSTLGSGFTTNGDALNFSYNGTEKIRPVGVPLKQLAKKPHKAPGPCITSFLDMRDHLPDMPLNDGLVLEDGTPPAILEMPYKILMKTTFGEDMSPNENEFTEFIHSITGTAFKNTLAFLSMSHDSANGKLRLDENNGRVWVHYPNIGEERNFKDIDKAARSATKVLKAEIIPNPMWGGILPKLKGTRSVVTVHPLGGCCMAETGSTGVVDHSGVVFKGDTAETYPGLLVVDGAVMPRCLGINPTLTISMVAERCMRLLAERNGWTIGYSFNNPIEKKQAHEVGKPGFTFTERMKGHLDVNGMSHDCEFTLTIESSNVEHMLDDDPEHKASIHGTVSCKALHDAPLTVSNGQFHLFRQSDEIVETMEMNYHLTLHGGDKAYKFKGIKVVHKDTALEIGLSDTTTLAVTVTEGLSEGGLEIGTGLLKIKLKDFFKQLTTMEVTNCKKTKDRVMWKAKFGKFFAGKLLATYGVLSPYGLGTQVDPQEEHRKVRSLKLTNEPDLHHIQAKDGIPLLLTRYRGGSKGPILLLHGLGMTHRIFALDTVETNLVEFLVLNGYDVWALELRFSIALPSHKNRSSISDPAEKDVPPAVDYIIKNTGVPNIQVFAHCAGSATLHTSLLGGHLAGKIRSVVVSQVGFCFIVSSINMAKADTRFPKFLQCIGVNGMSAYTDIEDAWHQKCINRVVDGTTNMTTDTAEHCDSDVCHRITFIYGLLWKHGNLNPHTHDTLHEWNGYVHVDIFKHFALCTRRGYLTDPEGNDTYLPDFSSEDRLQSTAYRDQMKHLDIPILYFSGKENRCWDTETTRQSYERCKEANPEQDYDWFEIPDYGHLDCLIGKDAVDDVFPKFLPFLEKYAQAPDTTK